MWWNRIDWDLNLGFTTDYGSQFEFLVASNANQLWPAHMPLNYANTQKDK
jgi:hypothetical protein